jgi:uncharacterized protein
VKAVAFTPTSTATSREARLLGIVESSVRFCRWLDAGRSLGLASWCIGAGALRNLVWDELHGYTTPSPLSDIDFAYFDADDLSPTSEKVVQDRLTAHCPSEPWEATNQAAVHCWFERHFGHAVAPLASLEAAVATWPEFATSVAITRSAAGETRIIAPHGLHDLMSMVVRRNPARVSIETYRQRVRDKSYSARWPRVQVVA